MKSVICVLALSAIATGQLGRLENCLPIPSYGSELTDYQDEFDLRRQTQSPKIQIDRVSFETQNRLTSAVRNQIANDLKKRFYDSDSDWLEEIAERARNSWQEHGYFKAMVSGTSRRLEGDGANQRFAVLIVVDEGQQYRLRQISFSPSTVFTVSELRKAIPMQNGEILNISKVRAGVEALRQMYGSKGYINFTGVPEFKFDETNGIISLKIILDEGKMYRISEIRVLGVDQSVADSVFRKWRLTPGNPYNGQLVEKLFRDDKSIIPPDSHVESDMRVTRDDLTGTVSLVIDVRRCPPVPSSAALSQTPN